MSISIQGAVENLTLSDVVLKASSLNVALKNASCTKYKGDWQDKVNISVSYAHKASFYRTFAPTIKITVAHTKKIVRSYYVNILTSIKKVANASQVIGDIRFYSTALNETSYDRVLTPLGYGKWKRMITGDYIYQHALCKFVLQASLNGQRPNARRYIHKVDVPDVIVRDTIELTTKNQSASQPYQVLFKDANVIEGNIDISRGFHIVPEVSTTIKSFTGAGTYPVILVTDITTTGFKVTMKVDTQFVAGSFTYAARGY